MWTDFLADPLVGRTGWTLVHFIWQGTLIALLLAAALHVIDERASNARYAAALAAFVLMAALPVLTWSLMPEGPTRPVLEAATPPAFADVGGIFPVDVEMFHGTSLQSGSKGEINQAAAPDTFWAGWLKTQIVGLLPYLVLGWLAGVLMLGTRLAGGFVQVQRLRRRGTSPVDEQWQRRFTDLAQHLCPHRTIRLRRSTRVEGPLALGWWRPIVLVPGSLFTGLPPDQVEAVLAHELAHLRRYDDVVNLLQSVLEVVLFYHPAIWWVSHQLRREREHCCDDLAAAAYSRLTYARALTELEALRTPLLAPGASDGSLKDRIRRLVGPSAPRRAHTDRIVGVLTVLLLVAGGVAVATFAPSRADAEGTPIAPPDSSAGAPILVDTTLYDAPVRIALSGDTLVFDNGLGAAAVDLDSLHTVLSSDTMEASLVHVDSLLSSFPKFTVDERSFSFSFGTDSLEMGFPEEVFALHIADSLGGLSSVFHGHLRGPERGVVASEVPQVFFRFRSDSIAHASPSQAFFGFWADTMEHPPPPPRPALPPPPPRPDTEEHPSPQVFFRGEWPDTLDYDWDFPELDSLDAQALYLWADSLQNGFDWEALREAQEEARRARQEALREWRQERKAWQEEYRQEMKERMQALREDQQERAHILRKMTREQQEAREEAIEEAQQAIEEVQRERQEAMEELQRERQQEQREIQAEQAEALQEAADALQDQAEELQQELDAVEGDSEQVLEKRNLLREQIRVMEQQARRLRERAGELEDGR